jgi:hypothetical protein
MFLSHSISSIEIPISGSSLQSLCPKGFDITFLDSVLSLTVPRFDGKHEFSFASYGYFPFGSGSSECMGKIFAHVEVSLFLCTLLRQYKFTPDPDYQVTITAGIYLATTNGIKVKISALEERELNSFAQSNM